MGTRRIFKCVYRMPEGFKGQDVSPKSDKPGAVGNMETQPEIVTHPAGL